MSTLVVALIAAGTLAFGGVYPWAYVPLLGIAAVIGLVGLRRSGVPADMRPLAWALALVCGATAAQLVPIPRAVLDIVSPGTAALSTTRNLALSGPAVDWLPISIDPAATRTALYAISALSLYLLGLPALLDRHGARALPRTLAMFAVPLALFGIYSREYHNQLIYWFWEPQDGGGANQFGPFINRNHFGGWMVMTLGVLMGALFGAVERAFGGSDGDRRRRRSWWSSAEANGIVLMAAAILLGVTALFWALSRSAMISFGVALAAFAWLVLRRRKLAATRRVAGVIALAAFLLAGVGWRGPDVLIAWFQDDRTLLSRFDAWRDTADVIRAFPLTGTGLNTYSTAMLFYQQRNPGWHMAQAHNDYLQLLAEGGLLIAVPAALAIVLFARVLRRRLRAASVEVRGYWLRAGAAVGLLAIAVQEIAEFSLQMPANALLFCTVGAIALRSVSGRAPLNGAAAARDTIHMAREPSGAALS
jgi:O-antigen ligase